MVLLILYTRYNSSYEQLITENLSTVWAANWDRLRGGLSS